VTTPVVATEEAVLDPTLPPFARDVLVLGGTTLLWRVIM
jgi:hypothetical protein